MRERPVVSPEAFERQCDANEGQQPLPGAMMPPVEDSMGQHLDELAGPWLEAREDAVPGHMGLVFPRALELLRLLSDVVALRRYVFHASFCSCGFIRTSGGPCGCDD